MSTVYYEYDGVCLNANAWAKRLGINKSTMYQRIRVGYSIAEIVEGRIRKRGQMTPEGEANRSKANTKHGHTGGGCQSQEYKAWADIKGRCTNPNVRNYKHYGARGIRVCQWFMVFNNFLAELGIKPTKKHSIDRRNNDGHYSCGHCDECIANSWPSNCHWVTNKEQQRNRRDNKLLTLNGKIQSMAAWIEELGVCRATVSYRLRKGWSEQRALTAPPRSIRRSLHAPAPALEASC